MNLTREQISEVLGAVIEEFAFAFLEIPDETDLTPPASAMVAVIPISGPYPLEFALAMPLEACIELAGAALGLAPGDRRAENFAEDAFRELANLTCTRLVASYDGGRPASYRVGLPTSRVIGHESWSALQADPHACLIRVEEHPAIVLLRA